MAATELHNAHIDYKNRFNCVVCLGPRLKMVYGLCQHRLCCSCLYDDQGVIRPNFSRCPICSREVPFPFSKPDIPEDTVELQKAVGVRQCEVSGCTVEFWLWELDDHMEECHGVKKTPPKVQTQKRRNKRKSNLDEDDILVLDTPPHGAVRRVTRRMSSCSKTLVGSVSPQAIPISGRTRQKHK